MKKTFDTICVFMFIALMITAIIAVIVAHWGTDLIIMAVSILVIMMVLRGVEVLSNFR